MTTPVKDVVAGEPDTGPSLPPTPKSGLFSGASLRRIGSKLSASSLSPKSRKGSPERSALTRLGGGHVISSPLPLRVRRGSLKPLSIVTTAFHPLDFDPVRVLEAARDVALPPSPSPPSPSKLDVSTMAGEKPRKRAIIDNMEMFGKQVEPFPQLPFARKKERDFDEETIKPARSYARLPPPIPSQEAMARSSAQRSTSFGIERNQNTERVITGNFASLLNLPPPTLNQHPTTQSDPNSAKSDAPLMFTTSTADEIRAWATQKHQHEGVREIRPRINTNPYQVPGNAFSQPAVNTSSSPHSAHTTPSRTSKPTGLRKNQIASPLSKYGNASEVTLTATTPGRKSSDTNGLKSKMSRLQIDRDNQETDIFDILAEGSPSDIKAVPKTPSGSQSGFKTTSEFEHRKTGLRKVSAIFKPKSASEKNAPDIFSQVEIPNFDGSNWYRPDLELFLRRTLNCWSRDYNGGDPKPRHPNTGKGWYSRNLKCTTCLENCCPICDRACCAYRSAVLALGNHKNNTKTLKIAEERMHQITTVFPYGREVSTFLQCTEGDETGCGKMICPDCCGQCPTDICKDVQCRRCKKDPWAICDWHDEEANLKAL
ncbi:hypothetical protein LTR84_000500 [Exophiala bonariae]|uniref:Uncharacterized protein n=1 Tax=Exophiala bonariae TaxID=1690606 RepID=A0AAV9NRU6_9EURO|nr:hypothetical protein LTR84_000500 [Exophiala bonariae]